MSKGAAGGNELIPGRDPLADSELNPMEVG
jgi:hypothetical protein